MIWSDSSLEVFLAFAAFGAASVLLLFVRHSSSDDNLLR